MSDELDPVPAQTYSMDYFLNECDGHDEYAHTSGKVLPRRLAATLSMAGDISGLRVLDLGCGRGELLRHCLERGASAVGVDYAPDALVLARRILPAIGNGLIRADVQELPFGSNAFDLVFALDIFEHLHPSELERMLTEVCRVLVPEGRLIVHTMPNSWYYRFGYPLFRLVQRLRGVRLPRNPRDRWRYSKHVHVNEQSLVMLSRSLRRAGFRARVRLHNWQDFDRENNRCVRAIMKCLATAYPFAWIFCDDLFAVATKVD